MSGGPFDLFDGKGLELEHVQRLQAARQREEMLKKLGRKPVQSPRGPQCPVCGGKLAGQFRKCQHCASDLAWVQGRPCEPGQEQKLEQELAHEAEKRRTAARCQRCNNVLPSTAGNGITHASLCWTCRKQMRSSQLRLLKIGFLCLFIFAACITIATFYDP